MLAARTRYDCTAPSTFDGSSDIVKSVTYSPTTSPPPLCWPLPRGHANTTTTSTTPGEAAVAYVTSLNFSKFRPLSHSPLRPKMWLLQHPTIFYSADAARQTVAVLRDRSRRSKNFFQSLKRTESPPPGETKIYQN